MNDHAAAITVGPNAMSPKPPNELARLSLSNPAMGTTMHVSGKGVPHPPIASARRWVAMMRGIWTPGGAKMCRRKSKITSP